MIYARVGREVAIVALDAPAQAPLDAVREVAAAQLVCLNARTCPQPMAIPPSVVAALVAPPTATPVP